MSETSCLKDHFLIALPNLQDPNFSRSVTYICEHTDDGTMGIVINRPSALELPDILQHMDIEETDRTPRDLTVFVGGPVQEDRGFLLHSPVKRWKSTLVITDEIAITTSQDILQAIAKGEGPEEVLIALGYAGWGPGQLEQELQQDSWLVAPASKEIIFHTPVEKRWEAAAALTGVDLNLITSTAGHA
ncbi:MAG: YqgE/AlgH family protein [Gammaproteobacteria bacterium]|nr:MAG: YqgE/AlgH family protein [Gammaproteobacteria bacterium]